MKYKSKESPERERKWVFLLMMFIGGYYGAFTYSIRGGVFCNAQTGNFVLLAMALGNGNWTRALYYVIPISAYCIGAFISETALNSLKKRGVVRWETILLVIEIIVVLFLGFLPENAPVQITQVLINFICSMQYNTFRQTQGEPVSTTFCTNHIRQVGVAISRLVKKNNVEESRRKLFVHSQMIGVFVLGGVISTILCRILLGKAIWFVLIPLVTVLFDLFYLDIKESVFKQ